MQAVSTTVCVKTVLVTTQCPFTVTLSGGTARWVQRPTEKPRRNTDAGSSPRCGMGFFSHCQLPAQSFLRCPYSPRVQLHASTSGRPLKKSQTLAAIPLFGHTKILHTLRGMGSAALAAAVPYPGTEIRISRKGQWNTTNTIFFKVHSSEEFTNVRCN